MAQFVSAGTRRRRLLVSCAVTGLLAFVLGGLLGRTSVPTIGKRAASVAAAGADLATRVNALTIEYEQALSSSAESVAKGVDEPLRGIETELQSRFRSAPWVTPAERRSVLAAIAAMHKAAADRVTATEFAATTSTASGLIRDALGVRR